MSTTTTNTVTTDTPEQLWLAYDPETGRVVGGRSRSIMRNARKELQNELPDAQLRTYRTRTFSRG